MSDGENWCGWDEEVMVGFLEPREEPGIPPVDRVVQVPDRVSVSADKVRWNPGLTVLPSGWMIPVAPMFNLYVYRQDGQARMIMTRVDPFHYEHVSLSELEMQMIMRWGGKMVVDGIGRFAPADGGWFWWAK